MLNDCTQVHYQANVCVWRYISTDDPAPLQLPVQGKYWILDDWGVETPGLSAVVSRVRRHDGNEIKIATATGEREGSLSTRTRTPRGCITPSHPPLCTHTHTHPTKLWRTQRFHSCKILSPPKKQKQTKCLQCCKFILTIYSYILLISLSLTHTNSLMCIFYF